MSATQLLPAFECGEALEVGLNEVKFISFADESPVKAMGARDLKDYNTVVIVMSPLGAVMAHLSLQQGHNTQSPFAAERHVRTKLTELLLLVDDHPAAFHAGVVTTKAGIICAGHQGQIAAPGYVSLVRDFLVISGLDVGDRVSTYSVEGAKTGGSDGMAFIDGRKRNKRKVYVEGRKSYWFR